jgi:hypothetical protein
VPVGSETWRRHRRARIAAVRSRVIRRWLTRLILVGLLGVLIALGDFAVYAYVMQRSNYPA